MTAPTSAVAPNTSARSTHAGQGRVVNNRATHGVDVETKIEALLAMPALWDLAALVDRQRTGQPRKLPPIFYCAMIGLQAIFGSFRNAEVQLRRVTTGEGSALWGTLCAAIVKNQRLFAPHDEPYDLATLLAISPLTAQNFHDARRSWLAPHLAEFEARFEACADAAAHEVGYARSTVRAPSTLVHERVATGDGKVVRAPGMRYRLLGSDELKTVRRRKGSAKPAEFVLDTTTGEIVSAAAMIGEEIYPTGAGLKIGYKITAISIRDDQPNSTVVLRLRRQTTTQEAQELTDAAKDVKHQHPGLLGFIVDGALRGTHHRQLAAAGIVPISPIEAASVKDGRRTEKTGLVEVVRHTLADGRQCVHEIHHHGGNLGEYVTDESGQNSFTAFGAPRIEQRHKREGVRAYAAWKLTCHRDPDGPAIDLGTLRYNITGPAPEARAASTTPRTSASCRPAATCTSAPTAGARTARTTTASATTRSGALEPAAGDPSVST